MFFMFMQCAGVVCVGICVCLFVFVCVCVCVVQKYWNVSHPLVFVWYKAVCLDELHRFVCVCMYVICVCECMCVYVCMYVWRGCPYFIVAMLLSTSILYTCLYSKVLCVTLHIIFYRTFVDIVYYIL